MTDSAIWYGCAVCGMRTDAVQAAAAAYQPCPHCGRYDYVTAEEYLLRFSIRLPPTPFLPFGPSVYDEQRPDKDLGDPLRWPLERTSR